MPERNFTPEEISAWIEKNRPLAVDLQKLLTSCLALAPESGGAGELARCQVLEEKLRILGFSHFMRLDAPDSRVPSGIRPNLVVTVPGVSADALWIMSHLDVVPPGDLSLWPSDPWTAVERDGKVFGRGTEDNQQGIVSSVLAALFFVKNGIQPARTLKLLFMADEENGSVYGIRHLLELNRQKALFSPSDFFIIPDSGDPQGETVEIAEKNVLWLDVLVRGKQAHGSRPDLGVNAHHAGCDLALRLHALERSFPARDPLFTPDSSTFQATRKTGNGASINIIPGEDAFSMDCRILPCYRLDDVRTEIRRVVAEIEKLYSVSVSITEQQAEESGAVSPDAPVVRALFSAVRRVLGRECRTVGIGGGTVAAYLRNEGYDAVVWGILEETAHQPGEYSVIANLMQESCVLAVLAADCSGA